MSKRAVLNQEIVFEKLRKLLSQLGPLNAKNLCLLLDISQSTFSRLIKQQYEIIRIGQGSQTLYACRRSGAWGKSETPIFCIDEKGILKSCATLHPIAPEGFYLESHTETISHRIYKGLPYLFEDLRPAGFLGRLIPRLHSDLKLPEDIKMWTDDHCLIYLSRYGSDLIGNWIIGEESYDYYLESRFKRLDIVLENKRKQFYLKVASLVLSHGIPGSSAAGEQPKFFSVLETSKGLIPVLVKFSPPVTDVIGRRVADLLICEQIAHGVLKKHGQASLQSCLILSGDQLFLEVERFDRIGSGGRRGVISLRALDLEFVGQLKSWSETAEVLLQQNKITSEIYQSIVWLEVFGKLIANSDRHLGNLSFFCEGEKIKGLAPVYDMLPMMYAPQQNQLIARAFDPKPPKFFEIAVWNSALKAACDFWAQVQRDSQISEEFKILVSGNELKLSGLFLQ